MKTRGATDFYLPKKIAYQIKMILGGLAVTVFFSLIWKGRPFTSDFWFMFFIAFLQLEIFMVIAKRIFTHGTYNHDTSYKKQILIRLIRFYLLVMVISAAVVFLTIAFAMYYYESTFSNSLNHFVQYELRRFLIHLSSE
ncbi:MAG: hypothetical protein U5K79_25390 [Cyclobacteriaceae bacterium]|nr:hypothetical protein [Cyclobacteriaceae bacterium]